jgi:hypothetical protein
VSNLNFAALDFSDSGLGPGRRAGGPTGTSPHFNLNPQTTSAATQIHTGYVIDKHWDVEHCCENAESAEEAAGPK